MVANGVNAQKGMVLFKTVRHNFTVLRLELIMTDVQVQKVHVAHKRLSPLPSDLGAFESHLLLFSVFILIW
jgi:hypothetical protein